MDPLPIENLARWVQDPETKAWHLEWPTGRAGDKDTTTVDGAAASAETAHRNPLTGLYW